MFILEKLAKYIPANTIDSGSGNATQNAVTSLLEIPCNILDHNYAFPHSFIAGQKIVILTIYINFVIVFVSRKSPKNPTF